METGGTPVLAYPVYYTRILYNFDVFSSVDCLSTSCPASALFLLAPHSGETYYGLYQPRGGGAAWLVVRRDLLSRLGGGTVVNPGLRWHKSLSKGADTIMAFLLSSVVVGDCFEVVVTLLQLVDAVRSSLAGRGAADGLFWWTL